MANASAITALIAPVHAAQERVGELRSRFDETTALGVPPHVTILAPFMSPQAITPEVMTKLHEAVSTVSAFRFRLARIGRFPEAIWLAPEPTDPFIALTHSLVARFPSWLPYGGRHDEIIPHLTVAHGNRESADIAETELSVLMRDHGPIEAFCDRISLLENGSGLWKKMFDFPLEKS